MVTVGVQKSSSQKNLKDSIIPDEELGEVQILLAALELGKASHVYLFSSFKTAIKQNTKHQSKKHNAQRKVLKQRSCANKCFELRLKSG